MQDQERVIFTRGSLLCAVLSVLGFILLFTMDFSWLIVLICAAVAAAGIVLALKSVMGERPRPLPLIALVVCVLALIGLIVYVILTINSPETTTRLIDELKDTSTVLQ